LALPGISDQALNNKFSEVYQGVLHVNDPSGLEGPYIAARLIMKLGPYVVDHKLGEVFTEAAGFILNPTTVYAPDVSFLRRDRVPYGATMKKFFPGAPDLAIEVLSQSDRFSAIRRKGLDYLDAGTQLVWIITPHDYSATILRAQGLEGRIGEDGMLDGENVVPGFRCALHDLFA